MLGGGTERLLRLPMSLTCWSMGRGSSPSTRLGPRAHRRPLPRRRTVRRLAQRAGGQRPGRRLDDAAPYVDLRPTDGMVPSVARRQAGTALSLRVPRTRVFSLDELVDAGTLSASGARLLARVVERRIAFLISGGTGSGKTTMLSTLLSLVDPTHRLVLVEDASELRPEHPHVVGLEARPANIEGHGQVSVRELVRQALRMRPIALWSARFVVRRWSISSVPSTPVTRAGAAPSTPTPRATFPPGLRDSPWPWGRARSRAQPVRVRHRHRAASARSADGRRRLSRSPSRSRPQRAGDDGDCRSVHRSGRVSPRQRGRAPRRGARAVTPAGGWSL